MLIDYVIIIINFIILYLTSIFVGQAKSEKIQIYLSRTFIILCQNILCLQNIYFGF